MKHKVTPIEIFVVAIVMIGLGFYYIPKLTLGVEEKQYAVMQANSAMATSKILSYFSDNTNKKPPTEIANLVAGEMNELVKNPIDKKNPAYSVNEECLGCVVFSPDDKVKNIVLTAKDKDNKLISRTVIQPPSFVTFNKDFKENER